MTFNSFGAFAAVRNRIVLSFDGKRTSRDRSWIIWLPPARGGGFSHSGKLPTHLLVTGHSCKVSNRTAMEVMESERLPWG